MSATAKVKPSTHARLQEIAKEQQKPMGDVITYLVDHMSADCIGKACVTITSD
jgi:hypothetical protein